MDELTLQACREAFERHIAGEEPTRILFKRGGSVFAEDVPSEKYVDGGIQHRWIEWQAAFKAGRASSDERERCARICETLAQMMLAGAGEGYPGNRLWQAARNIRSGGPVQSWYDPTIKEPQSDESANAARRASTVSATARVPQPLTVCTGMMNSTHLYVPVAPCAEPGPYPTAMRPATPEEAAHIRAQFTPATPTPEKARVPLSEEQIDKIAHDQDDDGWLVNQLTNLEWRYFARDIEKAHGITKEPQ